MNCSQLNIDIVDSNHSGTFDLSEDSLWINDQYVSGPELTNLMTALSVTEDDFSALGWFDYGLYQADNLLTEKVTTFFKKKYDELPSYVASSTAIVPEDSLSVTNPAFKNDLGAFLNQHPLVFLAETQTHTFTQHEGHRCADGCTAVDGLLVGSTIYQAMVMPENTGGVVLIFPVKENASLVEHDSLLEPEPPFGYQTQTLCVGHDGTPATYLVQEEKYAHEMMGLPYLLQQHGAMLSIVSGLGPSECQE